MGARNNRTLKPKPKVSKMSAAALKKFKKKPCGFCRDKVSYIDYKDINLLQRFMSDRSKIRGQRIAGTSVQQQREIANAVKNGESFTATGICTSARTSSTNSR